MLKTRFAEEAVLHYTYIDREQGYIQVPGKTEKVPFMTLSVGLVSPVDYEFADIREITEVAAEIRRRDTDC
jgi:hypothetical protein